MSKRKNHSASFKGQVALQAYKGEKTLAELASLYKIHPNQISKWKKLLIENIPELFNGSHKKKNQGKRGGRSSAIPANRPTQGGT